MKRNIVWLILGILIVVFLSTLQYSISKYQTTVSTNLILNISKPTYTVSFYPNITGNETEHETQNFTYDTAQNLRQNTFTRTSYIFNGWNTEADGTGTSYEDEEEVNNLTQTNSGNINLYAQWVSASGIAEVNGQFYPTLQAAVDAVTTSAQTTVKLLANTEEQITVSSNKNIVFNLQNFTVSRTSGQDGVIENYGTVSIINGKLTSSITGAVINNYKGATLYISGGSLIGTASKKGQAIYNKGGTVEISGNAYMCTNTKDRATVHNLADGNTPGTITITGGTIISNNYIAIINDKNSVAITIGTEDGTVDKTTPVIQGGTYGLSKNNNAGFNFYDGIIKGKTKAINGDEAVLITDSETGYDIAHADEIIDGKTYKTAYLAITHTVRFDPNTGTVDELTRGIENGMPVGALPTPTKTGFMCDGWYTLPEGGEEVLPSRIITSDEIFYAHWTSLVVAEINGTQYNTLQQAINAVPTDNTPTTIILQKNVTENVTVAQNKNIIFDMGNYSITNASDNAVIINNGTITIHDGTIKQNAAYGAINNNGHGKVIMTGGTIDSTGGKSAIYSIDNSTVEISGSALLKSNASETVVNNNVTFQRATVMGTTTSTQITITGGTIIGTAGCGVTGNGTITVGTKADGDINNSSPVILGETVGLNNKGTFNFYDGIIKGINDAILGTIGDQEPNTQVEESTETIDNKAYKTKYLEEIP